MQKYCTCVVQASTTSTLTMDVGSVSFLSGPQAQNTYRWLLHACAQWRESHCWVVETAAREIHTQLASVVRYFTQTQWVSSPNPKWWPPPPPLPSPRSTGRMHQEGANMYSLASLCSCQNQEYYSANRVNGLTRHGRRSSKNVRPTSLTFDLWIISTCSLFQCQTFILSVDETVDVLYLPVEVSSLRCTFTIHRPHTRCGRVTP